LEQIIDDKLVTERRAIRGNMKAVRKVIKISGIDHEDLQDQKG